MILLRWFWNYNEGQDKGRARMKTNIFRKPGRRNIRSEIILHSLFMVKNAGKTRKQGFGRGRKELLWS